MDYEPNLTLNKISFSSVSLSGKVRMVCETITTAMHHTRSDSKRMEFEGCMTSSSSNFEHSISECLCFQGSKLPNRDEDIAGLSSVANMKNSLHGNSNSMIPCPLGHLEQQLAYMLVLQS